MNLLAAVPTPVDKPAWKRGPVVFVATGFWFGLCPWMPGTVGAIWGLPLAWGVEHLPLGARLAVIVAICLAGIPICTYAVKRLGGKKDPGCVTFDEIASLPITFFGVPMTDWRVVLAGFLLHRAFDITKPPPTRSLERLPQGLGVMADDWMAGIYSCLALHGLLWVATR